MFSTITAAPAKQSVGETISVLSGRLSSATLLEDRRAAILGLRSFAKEYPASVASGALRSLIGSLGNDGEDVDTVKVVLETLLMLFSPNEDSPEASEEIALWLADEFTQRQENIGILLGLLATDDFYSRLYSLQLLSAILAARPERTEESMLDAPLSIPRIVAMLDDRREAIRNEVVALLTSLTLESVVIQNSVAFESAFERVFNIMNEEGGLLDGGRTVEDCLIFLANLLRLNAPNQSMFREMGFNAQLGRLLETAYRGQDEGGEPGVAPWALAQRNRNIYALLAVIRLFLVPGAVGTSQNQGAFLKDRVLENALQLAFTLGIEVPIKSEALTTCADMIRGNARLQESFAGLQILSPLPTPAPEERPPINGVHKVFVIDGLLDLTLAVRDVRLFDMRYAAYGALAMAVTEGDESTGEEVVTGIQTITAHLLSSIQRSDDVRVLVGYLMLLLCWLFEDLDGTNDFLGEASNVQGLIQAAVQNPNGDVVVQGLSTMLLGVIYEFSTKDSPVPRATLREIMLSRMGRDRYIDKMAKLRSHPLMRDFEVTGQKLDAAADHIQPDVFFDEHFVEFFKDNYSRIVRAIDRDPGLELSVVANGVQKGISRELVDSLRTQLEDKERALQEAQVEKASLSQQLGQEQADHRRTKESNSMEKSRTKEMLDSLRSKLETRDRDLQNTEFARAATAKQLSQVQLELQQARAEMASLKTVNEGLQKAHSEEMASAEATLRTRELEWQRQLESTRKTADTEMERVRRRSEAEKADLKATISRLEVDLMKAHKATSGAEAECAELRSQLQTSARKASEMEKGIEAAQAGSRGEQERLQGQLRKAEDERKAVQGELDDLLMVFADLEEKATRYEERLTALGQSISDGEEGDEDEGGDERADKGDDDASGADLSEEDGWQDANPDEDVEDEVAVISLVDDRVFPNALQMIEHCKANHSLDFLAIRDRLGLDFHGTVKLINFIRQRVHEGAPLPPEITPEHLQDDGLLKPVLDDDGLILCLDDLPGPPEPPGIPLDQAAGHESPDVASLLQKNAELQAELELLSKQFSNYRLAVQQTLDQRWGDDVDADAEGTVPGVGPGRADLAGARKAKDDSDYYFESYAHNEIHETMLKDTVRTDAYRDFIYQNKDLFEGKVVLDVGCGTGILSMFCAKAGAKQVIAVDRSDIIDKARENIFNNGLQQTIVCLKGTVEDVMLPVAQVDIIVSEWMGYCLLYEAMLPSILWARDKYLKPGGLLVPSHASLWVAPVHDPEFVSEHITFWRHVYGFDMKAMQKDIYVDARVQVMPASALCGRAHPFRLLDLHTVAVEDLAFQVPWQSRVSGTVQSLEGFLVWFDTFFARSRDDPSILADTTAADWVSARPDRTAFTTGPFGQETHWKQGLLLVEPRDGMDGGAGGEGEEVADAGLAADSVLAGEITYAAPYKTSRGYNITVTWGESERAQETEKRSQTWRLH
ncbi:hypothetical protein P8C59_005363 [Phyllachora maydis]|uniref:type I protein arginine methyltransferase n=1 Tax=Phyllachora maydis TaxID=1825666 RepID=A0AAD9I4I4_9PEZI|nr:hypothetical protein P8C59_005363 [Phyllachora maydis]